MRSESILDARLPSQDEREKRKKYLLATLATCIAVVFIGSVLHVVKMGANRIEEMRSKATYDPKLAGTHTRAAGEEIETHEKNEAGLDQKGYSVAEANALLTPAQWKMLDTMVVIPAGPFRMGTDMERADPQNGPEHIVNLPAYKMDKYLVTNAQYARFVAATGYRAPLFWKDGKIPKGRKLHPVTMVTWADARAYAAWAHKRLPSEAEWEKAARGTDGRRWPWGNKMEPNRLNTYYTVGTTTPVTAYPNGASPYGLLDMAGNVNEWTTSDFLPYQGTKASLDLFDVGGGSRTRNIHYKVLRGGTWRSDPFSTQSFHRNFSLPNYASDFYGFRCVSDVK
jgi:iron(II)-dependent oxidoreductase